jgi:hypothetical protein
MKSHARKSMMVQSRLEMKSVRDFGMGYEPTAIERHVEPLLDLKLSPRPSSSSFQDPAALIGQSQNITLRCYDYDESQTKV